MFRADVRVLNEYYDKWINHGFDRYFSEGWKQDVESVPEGVYVFYDQYGRLTVYGTKDPDLIGRIERSEEGIYRSREREFRDRNSVPVDCWRECLEQHSVRDGGITTVSYGNDRFRIKDSILQDLVSRMRVYRMIDEFYVVGGVPGLDEIVVSMLGDMLMEEPVEEEYYIGSDCYDDMGSYAVSDDF